MLLVERKLKEERNSQALRVFEFTWTENTQINDSVNHKLWIHLLLGLLGLTSHPFCSFQVEPLFVKCNPISWEWREMDELISCWQLMTDITDSVTDYPNAQLCGKLMDFLWARLDAHLTVGTQLRFAVRLSENLFALGTSLNTTFGVNICLIFSLYVTCLFELL